MQGYSVFPFILGDKYSTFFGSSDGQSVTDVGSLSVPSALLIVNLTILGTHVC